VNEPCPDPCAVGRAAAAAGQVCRYHLDRQLKTTRLHLLERIASLIATGEDQQAVIRAVLEQLEEDLGYRRGLVMLVLVGGDRLVVAATTGEAPDGGGTQTYGPGEGIIGQVLANGEPIILSDINRSQGFTDRIYRRQETAAARARTAFVCVPVTIGQEIVGTLSLDIVDPGASTELEACRGVLAIVAAMLGHDVAARREIRQAQERMGAKTCGYAKAWASA
jgi:Nif-specific regulatory protein